jgi:hypothetical protein
MQSFGEKDEEVSFKDYKRGGADISDSIVDSIFKVSPALSPVHNFTYRFPEIDNKNKVLWNKSKKSVFSKS